MEVEHHIVFRDSGYYAAWPHNGGMWQFEDGEVAVGFIRARCDYTRASVQHERVDVWHGEHVIYRSTDGGVTWPEEESTVVYRRPEFDEILQSSRIAHFALPGVSFDPLEDGYCLLGGFGLPRPGIRHISWTMVSTDRARTWHSPVILPRGLVSSHPFEFLSARGNYVIRPDGQLLLFAYGTRGADNENRSHPIVYAGTDGGVCWGILSEIPLVGPPIMGIQAYPLFLQDGTLIVSIRRQYNTTTAYTEIYASPDGGLTWEFRSRVNDWGAPATLVSLPDGNILCVYGYRRYPYGIRARISKTDGKTWGKEIVLRDDGGSFDLGYPRTVVRPDGSLLTVYYFNEAKDPIQQEGGIRHIVATIWKI